MGKIEQAMIDPSPRLPTSPEMEFPVTDDKLDAPDGTVIFDPDRVGWYERHGSVWVRQPCTDLQILSVSKLQAVADPFRTNVWGTRQLTRLSITRAVNRLRAQKRFAGGKPMEGPCWKMKGSTRAKHRWHVERVAWLVINGWKDPIEIDVGVPVLGFYPDWVVVDGNHRLAAAIYRKDVAILVSCSGQQSVIDEYLDTAY